MLCPPFLRGTRTTPVRLHGFARGLCAALCTARGLCVALRAASARLCARLCAALRAALHGSVRGLRVALRVALRLSWCVRHREQLVIGVLIGQFVSRVIWLIVIRFFKLV